MHSTGERCSVLLNLLTSPEEFDWQFDCFYLLAFLRGGSQMLGAVWVVMIIYSDLLFSRVQHKLGPLSRDSSTDPQHFGLLDMGTKGFLGMKSCCLYLCLLVRTTTSKCHISFPLWMYRSLLQPEKDKEWFTHLHTKKKQAKKRLWGRMKSLFCLHSLFKAVEIY